MTAHDAKSEPLALGAVLWKLAFFGSIPFLFALYAGFPSLCEASASAFSWQATVYTISVTFCVVAGQATGNVSQTDKLWSLLPVVYVGIAACQGGFAPRLALMFALVLMWSVRLTSNFVRRGGFDGVLTRPWAGEEDYRWASVRKMRMLRNPLAWFLFNLIFICVYQHILIYAFTLPAIVVLEDPRKPLMNSDVALAMLFLLLLVMETMADNQQFKYQQYKRLKKVDRRSEDPRLAEANVAKGFIDTGLWSVSRHPNYFAEQAMWVTFYCFSVVSSGKLFNWSLLGLIPLLTLFRGSIEITENLTASKYRGYNQYQKNVPMLVPFCHAV
eukprot:Selendium_serpulae@DN4941_c0_g1_i2.p1